MPTKNMTVAERVAALKNIFAEFGVPVFAHSALEHVILHEFGPGKRSPITQILLDLNDNTEAAVLSTCIGIELGKQADDPELIAIGTVMQERLPHLFEIINVRAQTNKREQLLTKLLLHFEQKLNLKFGEGQDRLLRMLSSVRQNLHNNLQAQEIGSVVEQAGGVLAVQDLRTCGRILQNLTPALIALDNPNSTSEQKFNHLIFALTALSRELHDKKMAHYAEIFDSIHWLARVSLPQLSHPSAVEEGLQHLGLDFASMSMRLLEQKAKVHGLNKEELLQILYDSTNAISLENGDQELLVATQQNKRGAAACSALVKLARDTQIKPLEQIGLAGLCALSLRQFYYELKTSNLTMANFSQDLGLILSSVGILTENKTIAKIGVCISDGVAAYAGAIATPGGAALAIPLAVCTVVSRLLLRKPKPAVTSLGQVENVLEKALQYIISLHMEMRQHFLHVYALLQEQHQALLTRLDRGFDDLSFAFQAQNLRVEQKFNVLISKEECLHFSLNNNFRDLYLEYINDPIEEIDFLLKYEQGDKTKLQHNKMKLSMWLLYKSRSNKANGAAMLDDVGAQGLDQCLANTVTRIKQPDAILALVNRYVQLEFKQDLPEDLPHIPSWVLAAQRYVLLLDNYASQLDLKTNEEDLIFDIVKVGERILSFFQLLSENQTVVVMVCHAWEQKQQILKQQIQKLILQATASISAIPIRLEATPLDNQEQLERFESITLDLSSIWCKVLAKHIPEDFIRAMDYGVGELLFKFAIDKQHNNFIHVHIPVSGSFLPDDARDVLYRIEVYFKFKDDQAQSLLLKAWFAYDLQTGAKRFEEYYYQKFIGPLRHRRYHWIGVDGVYNQVEGHGNTQTNKAINYNKVAQVYTRWWSEVDVITRPATLVKLNNKSVVLEEQTIYLLTLQIQMHIKQAILRQRIQLAKAMQQDSIINAILPKIDAYAAVLNVWAQVVNNQNSFPALNSAFNKLIGELSLIEAVDTDVPAQLQELFNNSQALPWRFTPYKQAPLYQKIELILAQLKLLANSLGFSLRFVV